MSEADLLGALTATQLTRAPGTKWEYSNFAMMVLSYALARRNGTDYETLLREHLLAPLGMADTDFNPPPAWRERIAPSPAATAPTPCSKPWHAG